MSGDTVLDVLVAGSGPAGLNAALLLGRARRRVLVCDSGTPGNLAVHASHGFLTRDGTSPAALRRIARAQLARYDSVELRDTGVMEAHLNADQFQVTLDDGTRELARRLLLATGLMRELPAIRGLRALWGRSVFDCPYCDGWEVRDQPLAVLGTSEANLQLAVSLTRWSQDVVWCTDGPVELPQKLRELLAAVGVMVRQQPVAHLDGDHGMLRQVVFGDGTTLIRRAGFLHPQVRQRSDLPGELGCSLLRDGSVKVDHHGQTDVPGVYSAGDMACRPDMPGPGGKLVIAAAEGLTAAMAIDQELVREDLRPFL